MSTIGFILTSALTLSVMLFLQGFFLVLRGLFGTAVGFLAVVVSPLVGLVEACLLCVRVARGHTVEEIWASREAAWSEREERLGLPSLERAAQRIVQRSVERKVEHSPRA